MCVCVLKFVIYDIYFMLNLLFETKFAYRLLFCKCFKFTHNSITKSTLLSLPTANLNEWAEPKYYYECYRMQKWAKIVGSYL